MSFQQISSPPAALAEVQMNENNAALGQGFLWSHDATADTGLTVGFNGGDFDGNAVADATVACTNNATNYVVAHRTTRALSVATSTTNWNNTSTYGRVARCVFASGVLTFHDERHSVGGIFDHAAAAATGVSSVNGETGVVTLTAGDIGIADSDSRFAGQSVEEALEELAASMNSIDAKHVSILDSDNLFAGSTVEEALEVLGAALASAVSSVNGHTGAVTLTAKDIGIFDSDSRYAGATVEEALEELGGAVAGSVTSVNGATGAVTLTAKDISILDSDSRYAGASIEEALEEIGASLAAQPFDVLAFLPGLQTAASQKILRVKLARAVTFAANFSGSQFAASANATGSTAFDIQKNGSSIGSCTIGAGGTTPTFATSGGAAQSFAAGDLLAIIGPASADATLADMGFTLVGTR